eukprot:scaffold15_cov204-Amphora_coffeaeformis.AAC.13
MGAHVNDCVFGAACLLQSRNQWISWHYYGMVRSAIFEAVAALPTSSGFGEFGRAAALGFLLAAVFNHHLGGGLSRATTDGFDGFNDIHSGFDPSKYDMFPIQPRRLDGRQEELRSIGIGSRIGRRQETGDAMSDESVVEFVGKFGPVDTLPTCPVPTGKVASLTHEIGNDPMKDRSLVMQGFALGALALFARTQASKVFGRLGDDIGKQFHNDLSGGFAINGDVKKDTRIFRTRGLFQGNLVGGRSLVFKERGNVSEDGKAQHDQHDNVCRAKRRKINHTGHPSSITTTTTTTTLTLGQKLTDALQTLFYPREGAPFVACSLQRRKPTTIAVSCDLMVLLRYNNLP